MNPPPPRRGPPRSAFPALPPGPRFRAVPPKKAQIYPYPPGCPVLARVNTPSTPYNVVVVVVVDKVSEVVYDVYTNQALFRVRNDLVPASELAYLVGTTVMWHNNEGRSMLPAVVTSVRQTPIGTHYQLQVGTVLYDHVPATQVRLRLVPPSTHTTTTTNPTSAEVQQDEENQVNGKQDSTTKAINQKVMSSLTTSRSPTPTVPDTVPKVASLAATAAAEDASDTAAINHANNKTTSPIKSTSPDDLSWPSLHDFSFLNITHESFEQSEGIGEDGVSPVTVMGLSKTETAKTKTTDQKESAPTVLPSNNIRSAQLQYDERQLHLSYSSASSFLASSKPIVPSSTMTATDTSATTTNTATNKAITRPSTPATLGAGKDASSVAMFPDLPSTADKNNNNHAFSPQTLSEALSDGMTASTTQDSNIPSTSDLLLDNPVKKTTATEPKAANASTTTTANTSTEGTAPPPKKLSWANVTKAPPVLKPIKTVPKDETIFRLPTWLISTRLTATWQRQARTFQVKYNAIMEFGNLPKDTSADAEVTIDTILAKTGWIVRTDTRVKTPIAQRKVWPALQEFVLSCHPNLSIDGRSLAACDMARANPHLYEHYSINASLSMWHHVNPNLGDYHSTKWTVLIEAETPNREAIGLLVGPNGRGIKEMRGNDEKIFGCVLDTHRICVYLDSTEEKRDLLMERAVVAQRRLQYLSRRYDMVWNT